MPVTASMAGIHEDNDFSAEPDKKDSIPAQSDPELPPMTKALRLWLLTSERSREHADLA
jgi:hypothetical protein